MNAFYEVRGEGDVNVFSRFWEVKAGDTANLNVQVLPVNMKTPVTKTLSANVQIKTRLVWILEDLHKLSVMVFFALGIEGCTGSK